MTRQLIERSRGRREFADTALLVTTAALSVSLVIAITAVSIGIARADALGQFADSGGGRWALAVFLGLVIAGMGGLTAAMVREKEPPLRRD
jgi:hypothetical protein